MSTTRSTPIPSGYSAMNPFFIARDADGLLRFVREVFGGEERLAGRTLDVDGLLLHAEIELDGTTLMVAERKPGWPFLPQLTQIYVDDVDAALARASERGGEIITGPTDFFGTVFSRMKDPWGNLWWIYQHGEAPGGWDTADDDADAVPTEWADPGLAYIHQTLLDAMPDLGTERGRE